MVNFFRSYLNYIGELFGEDRTNVTPDYKMVRLIQNENYLQAGKEILKYVKIGQDSATSPKSS